jgi:hypothetical protein
MSILLLDGSLKIDIFFEESDSGFDDDICISIYEDCAEEERLFKAEETNIYITPEQASLLVLALNRAMESYRKSNQEL